MIGKSLLIGKKNSCADPHSYALHFGIKHKNSIHNYNFLLTIFDKKPIYVENYSDKKLDEINFKRNVYFIVNTKDVKTL